MRGGAFKWVRGCASTLRRRRRQQGHQRITARQQIQARRALCAAPVLPYLGCRGEGKGRLKSLSPYDIGEVDGMLGDKSRVAIRAEQERLRHAVNGRGGLRLLRAFQGS